MGLVSCHLQLFMVELCTVLLGIDYIRYMHTHLLVIKHYYLFKKKVPSLPTRDVIYRSVCYRSAIDRRLFFTPP